MFRTTNIRGRTCRVTDGRTSIRQTAVQAGVLEAVGSPRPLLHVRPFHMKERRGRSRAGMLAVSTVQTRTSGGARVPPGRSDRRTGATTRGRLGAGMFATTTGAGRR